MSHNHDTQHHNELRRLGSVPAQKQFWQGPVSSLVFDDAGMKARLRDTNSPCYVLSYQGQIGMTNEGSLQEGESEVETLAVLPPLPAEQLGDPDFRAHYDVKYAYMAGSMANGIASEEHVIALGKARLLSSFGAAGLAPSRIETALQRIQQALPEGPYLFNLINSPYEPELGRRAVDLYLKYGVSAIEASAFMNLTPDLVRYRAAGLSLDSAGKVQIHNKVIAKLSRREVASKFLKPAPSKILRNLVTEGLLTEKQAKLAEQVPMADDITVEADSGGHTDNRPLVCLLPTIQILRDELQEQYAYADPIRIGAAGGIGTPQAALGAFMMGAAYVVTGSIMQSCLESGTSELSKKLLAQAAMTDVMMAPAADMFEMGVRVQVLKRGILFPMRAQKLFDLYKHYDSIEAIPKEQKDTLETQIFQKSLDAVWDDTVNFFSERDPEQLVKAAEDPKRKMSLTFRWYLGQSSHWAKAGIPERKSDYQIWCSPAMGAFNAWAKGSHLEAPEQRRNVDVSEQIMQGAASLYRVQQLKLQGLWLPAHYQNARPF